MKRISIAAALVAGTAIVVAAPAFAAGGNNKTTNTIHLGLTVVDECTINAPTITFPGTGIVDEDVDQTADLIVQCTKRTPYSIGLGVGDNAGVSGTVDDRKMMNDDSDLVEYQLYSDSGYNNVWGVTVGDNTVDQPSATGADEHHTIYARVHTGQNVPIGHYTDTVTATIWYADDSADGGN